MAIIKAILARFILQEQHKGSLENGTDPSSKTEEEAERAIALENFVPDTPEEKRIVRKIDYFLLPCLWWMYTLAYLDRGNIANANAAGLSKDLGMSDNQYSLFIATFFIGYFLFEVPSNLVMTKLRPSFYLPTIVTVWGCVVMGMSQSSTYQGFLVGRFFLGAIEAGLFPGALFLMTCWYTKKEIGKRFSIFYTSGCVAPALGGIMAGAIIDGLDGARGIPGWRWLILIEGAITVVFGIGFYFVVPDYPENARIFTPQQRYLAYARILHDRDLSVTLDSGKLTSWQAVKAVVLDGRSWIFLVLYTCDCTCTTIAYFLPTLLKTLGYTDVTAQWMSVPIWCTGIVSMLVVSYTSDRTQDRRFHNMALFAMPAVASLITLLVEGGVVRYVMMCFVVAGVYPAIALILNWASECIEFPAQKRSVAIAFVNSFGHLSLIYGSYLWPTTDAPRHVLGFGAFTGILGFAALLAAVTPLIIKLLPTEPVTSAEREILALVGQGREGQVHTVEEKKSGFS